MTNKRVVVSNLDVPDIARFFDERDSGDLTPTNLGWAAGFLEGEGTFGWYISNPKKPSASGYACVVAPQDDRQPLDRLEYIFGVGRVGRFYRAEKWRHEWRVNGHMAIAVMRAVHPLMCDRRQARIAEVVAAHEVVQERVRARAADPTCSRGHLWSENTGRRKNNGSRYCLACMRENAERLRAEKKAAAAKAASLDPLTV